MLSKRDYDKVLDIKPSKELKERVGFLRVKNLTGSPSHSVAHILEFLSRRVSVYSPLDTIRAEA